MIKIKIVAIPGAMINAGAPQWPITQLSSSKKGAPIKDSRCEYYHLLCLTNSMRLQQCNPLEYFDFIQRVLTWNRIISLTSQRYPDPWSIKHESARENEIDGTPHAISAPYGRARGQLNKNIMAKLNYFKCKCQYILWLKTASISDIGRHGWDSDGHGNSWHGINIVMVEIWGSQRQGITRTTTTRFIIIYKCPLIIIYQWWGGKYLTILALSLSGAL